MKNLSKQICDIQKIKKVTKSKIEKKVTFFQRKLQKRENLGKNRTFFWLIGYKIIYNQFIFPNILNFTTSGFAIGEKQENHFMKKIK